MKIFFPFFYSVITLFVGAEILQGYITGTDGLIGLFSLFFGTILSIIYLIVESPISSLSEEPRYWDWKVVLVTNDKEFYTSMIGHLKEEGAIISTEVEQKGDDLIQYTVKEKVMVMYKTKERAK